MATSYEPCMCGDPECRRCFPRSERPRRFGLAIGTRLVRRRDNAPAVIIERTRVDDRTIARGGARDRTVYTVQIDNPALRAIVSADPSRPIGQDMMVGGAAWIRTQFNVIQS